MNWKKGALGGAGVGVFSLFVELWEFGEGRGKANRATHWEWCVCVNIYLGVCAVVCGWFCTLLFPLENLSFLLCAFQDLFVQRSHTVNCYLCVCVCVFSSLQRFRVVVLISLSYIHDNGQTVLASEPQNKMTAHCKTHSDAGFLKNNPLHSELRGGDTDSCKLWPTFVIKLFCTFWDAHIMIYYNVMILGPELVQY